MQDIVVALTGASGAIYAVRLLQVLLAVGRTVHLTISPAAAQVLRHELGIKIDLEKFDQDQLLHEDPELSAGDKLGTIRPGDTSSFVISSVLSDSTVSGNRLQYHHHEDFSAGIASGSFPTAGMVICPCSMGTLAGIANGLSKNLIQRAADVHLKERRKLIVVPRETPLGSIQLENMKRLADAGAIVLPAMPAFYHNPTTIHDLIDFVVSRICDQLEINQDLIKRWGG